MKKYILLVVLFLVLTFSVRSNVLAEEYYSFGLGTANCSGSYCANFDNGNNIITIPNNSSSTSISRGETNLNYSTAIDMSAYNGFLVQIDVSYFDNMPTAVNETYTDSWICTNSINESGTITYADGTSARVALGAECTEWGANASHSTTTNNGTLMTSSYTSLLYWFSNSGSVNSCFLQTADNNHLTYNCPITANASNKSIKYLKLVSYFRSDSDIKVEIARYGMLAYKSDTTKIVEAINNQTSSINGKLDTIISNQQQAKQDNDEWKNTDISNSDKESPDTTDYNSYQSAENNLFSKMEYADTSNLNISTDTNSLSWIWSTIISFYNSNALLMNFVISILSIGIIKMALGR